MATKIKACVRGTSKQRTPIDLIPAKGGVEPKRLPVGGSLEVGPEFFEGYHYKGLIKSGVIREIRRIEVPEKEELKPSLRPKRIFERREPAKKASPGNDNPSSGEPASELKDG